jgi:hypothetical protein
LATTDPDVRLRHIRGVVGPLLLVALAAWVYTALPSAGDLYGRAAARPTVTVDALKVPTPPAAAPTNTARTPPAPAPTSSRATSGTTGPGVTEPGIRITATPTQSGTLEVAERVLVRTPIGRLELAPPDLTGAGGDFAAAFPRVSQLRVTVGGLPMTLPSRVLTASRSIVVGLPIHTYELRYVLQGAFVRSSPSTAGRGLAALAPLSRSLPPPSPVVIVTRGATVRNLSCPLLTGNALTCSDGVRGAMSVREPLPLQDALVILQLDLPST